MTELNTDGSADGDAVDSAIAPIQKATDTLVALLDSLATAYQRLASLNGQVTTQPHLNPGQVAELNSITLALNAAGAEAAAAMQTPSPTNPV